MDNILNIGVFTFFFFVSFACFIAFTIVESIIELAMRKRKCNKELASLKKSQNEYKLLKMTEDYNIACHKLEREADRAAKLVEKNTMLLCKMQDLFNLNYVPNEIQKGFEKATCEICGKEFGRTIQSEKNVNYDRCGDCSYLQFGDNGEIV